MRGNDYDEEAARREPLLASEASGSGGAANEGGGGSSRRPSPNRTLSPDRALKDASTPGGAFRLTRRSSTLAQDASAAQEEEELGGLVLKDPEEQDKQDNVRELEVEVVAGAVAEAVAEAVQEAVQEAVHDAVQQAIEENVQFDVRANVFTLFAVTGVILFWRGVWNTWDALFGTELASNIASMLVGLTIMSIIRILNLPLVEGLPGG